MEEERSRQKRVRAAILTGFLRSLVPISLLVSLILITSHMRAGVPMSDVAFLGWTVLASVGQAFIALMLSSWLRDSHGTSDMAGVGFLWTGARIVALTVMILCGLTGTVSFGGAYLGTIVISGILDILLVFASL